MLEILVVEHLNVTEHAFYCGVSCDICSPPDLLLFQKFGNALVNHFDILVYLPIHAGI